MYGVLHSLFESASPVLPMSSSGSRTQLVPAIPSRVPSVAQLDAAARKAAAEEARAFARYAGTPAVAAAEAQEAALHVSCNSVVHMIADAGERM